MTLGELEERMLEMALELLPRCRCPHSGFRVTAVLEDGEGELHGGVNVEATSYGLTVCAERSALVSALSAGASGFRRLLVHSPDGEPIPCGACRELLSDYCGGGMPVLVSGPGGVRRFTLGELLPERFTLPGRSTGSTR